LAWRSPPCGLKSAFGDFSLGEGEWGECGERRFGEDAKAQELQEIEKLLQFQHFDANR